MWLDLSVVINAGQAEAKELEELSLVAGNVSQSCEILSRDLRPNRGNGILDFWAHFPVIDPYAAYAVALELSLIHI